MKTFNDWFEDNYEDYESIGYQSSYDAFKAGIEYAIERARERANHIQHRVLENGCCKTNSEYELRSFAVSMEKEIK